MAKLTKEQTEYIRKDWIDAVNACVLDNHYGELEGKELKAWVEGDTEFQKKFKADTEEFAKKVIKVRELQAKKLLKNDPKYFSYLKDPVRYVNFATYGGTECRLLYRAYFMVKGYKSFKGWDKSLDGCSVKWYADCFKQLA